MSFWKRVRGWVAGDEVGAPEADEPNARERREEREQRDARTDAADAETAAAEAASATGAPAHAHAKRRPGAGVGVGGGAPDPSDPRGVRADLDRLASLALGRIGEAEALEIVRRLRGTVDEAEAVARASRAIEGRVGFEGLRVACADLLAVRGDEDGALRMLEGTTSTAGLMLAADLHAARGQTARAVVTVERVLARDIDAPGAMERFRRLRAALGAAPAFVRRLDEATALAAAPSEHAFRLLREVARGGAGVVYEAEDEVLGRRVAFKVYHGRANDRAALLREVRVAEALAGPGVVRVFDADPASGWVALEWAPRGSLREALRSPDLVGLPPLAAWPVTLAAALARVHARGWVHGDVKPANVLVRRSGEPLLSDFGIARRAGDPAEGGSPGYVSPERLAGAPFAPTDDVYGFGRILEDVLERVDALGARAEALLDRARLDALRRLSLACVGEASARPADGTRLTAAVEAALGQKA